MCLGLSASASKTTDYVCLKIYLIFYVILSVLIDSEWSHPVFQFSQAWEFIQVYNGRTALQLDLEQIQHPSG